MDCKSVEAFDAASKQVNAWLWDWNWHLSGDPPQDDDGKSTLQHLPDLPFLDEIVRNGPHVAKTLVIWSDRIAAAEGGACDIAEAAVFPAEIPMIAATAHLLAADLIERLIEEIQWAFKDSMGDRENARSQLNAAATLDERQIDRLRARMDRERAIVLAGYGGEPSERTATGPTKQQIDRVREAMRVAGRGATPKRVKAILRQSGGMKEQTFYAAMKIIRGD